MTKDTLQKILQKGETQEIEFKQTPTKDLAREITAFANTNNGTIYIGITDEGEICGTDTSNKARARIEDLAQSITPRPRITIETLENKILALHVKEGTNKPYMCPEGFFIRTNSQCRKLGLQEIYELFTYGDHLPFDTAINRNAAYPKDFSREKYTHYLKLADIDTETDCDTILENLNCLTSENKKKYLTNTGVLFFSKEPAKHLPQSAVICALYKGNDKTQILDRKEYTGTIIENIESALTYLESYLNTRYEITGPRRKEIPDIPKQALREAVVNAVCHRNYLECGAHVMVEIFRDYVTISNPGGLPKGLKETQFGKISVARNPEIAQLLFRANYIEKMGTGILRIRTEMDKASLPSPKFEYDTFFVITLWRESGLENRAEELSENGRKIVEMMQNNKTISISELSASIGISQSTVTREIKTLKKNAYISRVGNLRTGYWEVHIHIPDKE